MRFNVILLLAAIAVPPAVLILDSLVHLPPRTLAGFAGRLLLAAALVAFTAGALLHGLMAAPA